MKNIAVAMMNYKGGVGKTTLAIILAEMALMRRQRVRAVDLDPQKNYTFGLNPIARHFEGVLHITSDIGDIGSTSGGGWTLLDCPVKPEGMAQ